MATSRRATAERTRQAALIASAAVLGVLAVALLARAPALAPVAFAPALVAAAAARGRDEGGLQVEEIERLRRAELTLAAAPSTEAAARELAGHAMALLGAPAAVVLIEGQGDTVRVAVGDLAARACGRAADAAVYEPGSRMRLLEEAGTTSGSIAVAARRGGRPYDQRDERVLDALAERVSSTLNRLSLFDAVRTEQRTLSDVLSCSSDGIMTVGPDLQIRSWNPAMARITGVPEADAVGRHCCSVFRPLDEASEPLHGARCPGRREQPVEDLLFQIRGDDAPTRWLNGAFSPLSDGGYVLVARDVTARKQVEDDKADFLATVSHELRTPLTPIKGFLQTLLRRDGEFQDADRRHIYEVMLREEARLERLVHQLLRATSLDGADRLAEPRALDWEPLVAEQVGRVRRQDPTRDIDLSVAADLPRVLADPDLAQEVLECLLSNAVLYSPPGSPVRVDVERDGISIVTTVVDRGPGVASADRERIFERFTRLGDHLTRAHPGVGLGLYIARRSVESMGGRIWVVGEEEGGSAFSFTLPVARPTTAARAPRGGPDSVIKPLAAPGWRSRAR